MAIAPAGAMYKSLTFDNKTSREFGVYITGEAVYNAPEREVEMITIPGRNGAFALDKGRFENIPVKYPAGIFAENESDFAQAMSDFRNFLCSKQGYCRLTDDYNPNEYRMAVYKSGLEVDPAQLRAGEFEILFDAMPQRWLTSGETKQPIAASGDTITNPTLFDSKPLLEVDGSGSISFNGQSIEIESSTVGDIVIASTLSNIVYSGLTFSRTIALAQVDLDKLNTGDTISISANNIIANVVLEENFLANGIDFELVQSSLGSATNASVTRNSKTNYKASNKNTINFVKGTSSTSAFSFVFSSTVESYSGGSTTTHNDNVTVSISVAYNGSDAITITVTLSGVSTRSGINVLRLVTNSNAITLKSVDSVQGLSTKPLLTGTIYIDLDIGEAYEYIGGNPVSANSAVQIPADLPTLTPGSNTITFDNTITSLKITPRWWKL